MKPTWHRVSTRIFGESHAPGTASLFFDYDLGRWSFGFRFEHDKMWFDYYLDLGPISFSFCYWRKWQHETSDDFLNAN